MKTPASPYMLAIAGGALALGLAGVYVWHRGIKGAASDLGGAAVDAAGGVVTGVVGGVSEAVGVPTPSQTTTDPAVARWIIDRHGYFEASKWSGAVALARAIWMDAGTGREPEPGSDLARYLASLPSMAPSPSYDETDRLRSRYPAPAELSSYEPVGYAYGA